MSKATIAVALESWPGLLNLVMEGGSKEVIEIDIQTEFRQLSQEESGYSPWKCYEPTGYCNASLGFVDGSSISRRMKIEELRG